MTPNPADKDLVCGSRTGMISSVAKKIMDPSFL